MKEYIEREAVMQEFADYVKWCNNSGFAQTPTWNEAVQIVEDAPAADVVEVRHGRWIDRGTADNGDTIGMCSACRRTFRGMKEIGSVGRFCPHCGAKMDGGADE